MIITTGTQLGAYQILSLIGEGGMGRVFRARDTKLKREVAIKILPEQFSEDADRIARFQREAEALAALNHPNIAGIHDVAEVDGSRFLVLELVEGETLAERIAHGRLSVDEVIETAKQIAEALEAAHDRGIVHRDLKPANIKITPDGKLKILDFGLAKMWEPPRATTIDSSNTPTAVTMTKPGLILGTPAYMSPEQARNQPVDRGTDIWAFGCVLFEMLTGRKAFDGETITDTLSAIVRMEPDWSALPKNVPAHIARLLRRCLAKDHRRRLRDAGAVLVELNEEPVAGESTLPVRTGRERRMWIAATLILLIAFSVALLFRPRPATLAPEMRLEINTPAPDLVSFAISPDGSKLVFVSASEGPPRLWLRSLDSTSAKPLAGTDGAQYPFWSPDSRSIAFFADSKLKRIEIAGGAAQTLAGAPAGRGGTWGRGMILFSPGPASTVFRIPDAGGEPVSITRFEPGRQSSHRFPEFLPDGRHFLFYAQGTAEDRGIHVASLDESSMRRLADADAAAKYASGHLFFVSQGTLFAQRFNVDQSELTASPLPIAQQVPADQANSAAFATSATGLIAYRSSTGGDRQFVWFDRSGREIGKLGTPDSAFPFATELSPDGRHVAFVRTTNGLNNTWMMDTERGTLSRSSNDATSENYPVWSPDGQWIAFNSNRSGTFDLYRRRVSTADTDELLRKAPNSTRPFDWSQDGRFLLYRGNDPAKGIDIWALPLDGDRKPFPVVQTNSDDRDGQFSHDGKWIAYQSNDTGRSEIYIQPFRERAAKTAISSNGGAQVRWRRDDKELFYLGLNGQLMAVPIRLDSNETAKVGVPVALFQTHIVGGALQDARQYVVAPDGQRFLINTFVGDAPTSPITVVLNWRPPS